MVAAKNGIKIVIVFLHSRVGGDFRSELGGDVGVGEADGGAYGVQTPQQLRREVVEGHAVVAGNDGHSRDVAQSTRSQQTTHV